MNSEKGAIALPVLIIIALACLTIAPVLDFITAGPLGSGARTFMAQELDAAEVGMRDALQNIQNFVSGLQR